MSQVSFEKTMKSLTLLIFFAVFYTAFGLKCYRCRGTDCAKARWDVRECEARELFPGHRNACMKLDYIDRMTHTSKVERKCVVVEMRDDGPFLNCPVHEGYPLECPVCLTDLCNSSSRPASGLVAVLGAIVLARLLPLF